MTINFKVVSFLWIFFTETLYAFFSFLMHATCLTLYTPEGDLECRKCNADRNLK
jgi:hypothetical protein